MQEFINEDASQGQSEDPEKAEKIAAKKEEKRRKKRAAKKALKAEEAAAKDED